MAETATAESTRLPLKSGSPCFHFLEICVHPGCIAWWNQREETERAWKVPAAELLANGCNLDRKNPRAKEDITHLPPEQLAASILEKEQRIAEIMGNIRNLLAKHGK